MVFAAAGLSPGTEKDFCDNDPLYQEGVSYESEYQLWPPGLKCTYLLPGGRTVTKDDSNAVAFFAILAAGLLLVAGRRSKLAIATAFIFGAGGLTGFYVGFVPIPFGVFWIGLPLALLTTRSLPATAIASVALAIGWCAQFFDELPAIYAILLLILMLIPQRAAVVQKSGASSAYDD